MAHKAPEFDALVQEAIAEWHVPGLAVAVIHGDEVFDKGYGVGRMTGERITPHTLFDCASTSKSFTAAAVALLVHNDDEYPDIKWTTPVSKLLPDDFVLMDSYCTEHVTVEDILSHQSGMPGHDESYLGVKSTAPDDPKSITQNLRYLPMSRPLRTKYQYCNMMFTVASYMVQVVSGEQYGDFLKTRIWEPLKMLNTHHDITGVQAANATALVSHGHYWDESTESYSEIPFLPQPEGQGAGLVFSCVNDYAKWVQCLIKQNGPLPLAAHKSLVIPRAIMNPDEEVDDRMPFYSHPLYALGLVVESYRGRTVIGHDGDVPGFKSCIRYLPELEWGIVILGNARGAADVAEIIYSHLIDDLLNVPILERVDWPTFCRERAENSDEEDEEEHSLLSEQQDLDHEHRHSISRYVGKYRNAGYHDINIQIKDEKLWADCSDRTFGFILSLRHEFGETFIAEMCDVCDFEKRNVKTEFKLGTTGEIQSLGVEFEEEMKPDMIWFTRVE